MKPHSHILNAASNLLGICFILITGLKLTNRNGVSRADELAWASAIMLLASCLAAYLSLRHEREDHWLERWADRSFLLGLILLFAAVVVAAIFV